MKLTNIEKYVLTAIAVCVVLFFVCIWNLNRAIDQAGGMRAVIISTGKEIKSINQDINKE